MKVLVPQIQARVKKTGDRAGARVDAGEIRPFVAVAAKAGQREIFRTARTTMLPGDDVIELKAKFRQPLREMAVFATEARPPPDQGAQARSHRTPTVQLSTPAVLWI